MVRTIKLLILMVISVMVLLGCEVTEKNLTYNGVRNLHEGRYIYTFERGERVYDFVNKDDSYVKNLEKGKKYSVKYHLNDSHKEDYNIIKIEIDN